jgi:hypothetical protein
MKLTFSQFLIEGGWSKTITQSVKLTPKVAKAALAIMPKFEKDFNSFLKTENLHPIKIGKPVGSSAYIDRDLKSNPTKEYGDIDIIMSIPKIEGMADNKASTLYSNKLKEFVKNSDLPYLYKDDANAGTSIIVKVGEDWVQVDLVKAMEDIEDWVQHRMTPEHNLKGALIGYLYSSLAEVLNLSIGSSGVQAKEKDGEIVTFRNLKADRTHTISSDIGEFGTDILTHFFARGNIGKNLDIVPALKFSPQLKSTPGMNRTDIKVADLVKIVKGLGKSFELNNMYERGALKHIKDYDDFMSKVKRIYAKKTTEAASATKFNKAETEDAKRRALETKDLLLNKSKDILKLLED